MNISAFDIVSLVLYCWNNGVDSQGMDKDLKTNKQAKKKQQL